MDLESMSGAGGTIKLNGRTFVFRKHTLEDLGLLQAWVREKIESPYVTFSRTMKELLPMKEVDPEWYRKACDDLLLEAKRQKDTDALMKNQAITSRIIEEHHGMEYMIWLSIRKDAVEVTPEDVVKWVQADLGSMELTPELMEKLKAKVQEAQTPASLDPTKPVGASQ